MPAVNNSQLRAPPLEIYKPNQQITDNSCLIVRLSPDYHALQPTLRFSGFSFFIFPVP